MMRKERRWAKEHNANETEKKKKRLRGVEITKKDQEK